MFRNPKKDKEKITSEAQSAIPDPWKVTEPEPHFPSPTELDRMLSEHHQVIGAAPELLEIEPEGVIGAALLPAHVGSADRDAAAVLLKNELKLHGSFVEKGKVQFERALALLYWVATKPEQLLT